jgi:hypothetical protein
MESLAIGCGSAYAEDRIEPALALAAGGRVNYMAFDCLAERTLALAQARRLQDAEGGYDRRIRRLVPGLADFLARGNRVVAASAPRTPARPLRALPRSSSHARGARGG